MEEKETFAKIVDEMSDEEKNTEFDYVGIVASRMVGEKGGNVFTEVSEDAGSDIALLGRLEALGLALGFSHDERIALSNATIPAAKKILASIDKKARKEIKKAFRARKAFKF
jgi:phage terminase large subunit